MQGQHEPLISEALFDDVQDVLNGRKKIQRTKLAVDERKISSMFPEKLTFDGFQYRINRANEAITLMCLIDNKIEGKKNGTSPHFSDLSQEVTPLVQNSNYLLEDLKLLVDILAA